MKKVKIQIFFTEKQHVWLQEQKESQGLAVSDLVRRALEDYMEKNESKTDSSTH